MSRPIWKGSISFGLVTIPVAVLPATSAKEKISFRMLRKGDLSPIKYKRVAENDGKEVPWDEIVKGYEYEKGGFVVFEDKDFEALPLESAESVAIQDFVDEADINPIFYHTPYYMEPTKGGAGAYALLRDVLADTGKVGIAKVTLRNREHLAAIKASGELLVMELMHFAHEINDTSEIKVPAVKALGAREKQMAKTLIDQMSAKWDPQKYHDDYAEAVMKLVDEKVKSGGKVTHHKPKAATATNVVDLVSVLEESLKAATKTKHPAKAAKGKKRATAHKHAA